MTLRKGNFYFFGGGGGGGGDGRTLTGGRGLELAPSLRPYEPPAGGLGGGGLDTFLLIRFLPSIFHKFNPFNINYIN